jgi:hypothetical protein
LEYYNQLAGTDYTATTELIYSPPSFQVEMEVRNMIVHTPFDLGAILIVDETPDKKIEILLESKTYSDVKETLIELD